jgi:sigma-B regulation protein RsbU (phosphoserine phosphatase)
MSTGSTSIFKSVFKGLDQETLDALRGVAQRRSYPAQTILCHQGEIETTFYIVVEGQVAITQVLENGEERLLAIRGKRDYFGELGLMDAMPRMANCVTITPVTVLEITEEVFDKVLETSPAVAQTLIRHVVEMLRETDRHAIKDLTVKNQALEEAYRELKAAQAELVEKERLEREMEIAADVQRTLLPDKLPVYDDVQFVAYLQPSRYVGGDLYAVFELDGDHVGLLLADVADKSVQAALFMAVTRTLFMLESQLSLSPASVALRVHQGILNVASSADTFVTAFYGVLHRPSGQLTYTIAGHDRPLLYRPGKGVQSLLGRGRFLGMLEELHLDEYAISLKKGDRLLIYSDGVIDATARDERQYGLRRLKRFFEENQHLSLQEMVDRLVDDINKWQGPNLAFDDVTMLALEAV